MLLIVGPVLIEGIDAANTVRQPSAITAGKGQRRTVVAQLVKIVFAVDASKAGFPVAFVGLDKGGRAVDGDTVIGQDTLIIHYGRRCHLVEPAEEREVHVGNVEQLAVQRRDGKGATDESVFHPDAVLEQQRHKPEREGQVHAIEPIGETVRHGTQIALEEQAVQI